MGIIGPDAVDRLAAGRIAVDQAARKRAIVRIFLNHFTAKDAVEYFIE